MHNTQDSCYLHPRGNNNEGYNILLNPRVHHWHFRRQENMDMTLLQGLELNQF